MSMVRTTTKTKVHPLVFAALTSPYVAWLDKATLVRAVLYSDRLNFRVDAKPARVDEAIKLELTWLSPMMQAAALGIFSAGELQRGDYEPACKAYVELNLENMKCKQ